MKLLKRLPLLCVVLSCLMFVSTASANEKGVQVGDVLKISLPGEESLNRSFEVNIDGRIALPEVGNVHVKDFSEAEIQQRVKLKLQTAFRDLERLEVYIEKRQTIVNVLGYVRKPGQIKLKQNSSIQTALIKAGGLRPGAQLDKMQLRRGDQVITFNYKSYLDSGDVSQLPAVQSLDTLFVPASPMIGNVEVEFDPSKIADGGDAANDRNAIKVFGEVNSPGSFSYKEGSSTIDYLMKAGGVTRYAGVEQIRLISKGEPVRFDLKKYLDTGDETYLPQITPGATLFIPRQEEAVKTGATTVYVMGEVFEPGAYESNQGVTFMDILANAGGPTRFAESRQIRIIRPNGDVQDFDLAGYTEGTSEQTIPEIGPGDAIFVPEKTDMNEKSWLKIAPARAVRVIGEVVRPGRIEWSDEMSLIDLLAHVGGPTSRADTANIEVMSPNDQGEMIISNFNLDIFIENGTRDSDLPIIRAGATVRVHDLPQDPTDNKSQWVRQASEKSIYIMGEVAAPGRYMFTNEMDFIDILAAAEGPTSKADLRNVKINHRNEKHIKVTSVNLHLYFETGDKNLIPEVKTGDTIFIPARDKLWLEKSKESTVRVLGEVKKPGRYTFDDSMTLLDILAEAGGTTGDANRKDIRVVNLSCCKNEAKKFNLRKFSKTGDFSALPVLRAGDTVFVPSVKGTRSYKVRQGVRDVFEFVTLGFLLGM